MDKTGAELPASNTLFIESFLSAKSTQPKSKPPVESRIPQSSRKLRKGPTVNVPCGGLSAVSNGLSEDQRKKIRDYIGRVAVQGAGSQSLTEIKEELFPRTSHLLS